MNHLDLELLEEFKHLERFCNQIYGDKHGVTCYIEDMKAVSSYESSRIDGWDLFLSNLMLVRHKRNLIVHNDIEDPCVEEYDIAWIKRFRQLLLSGQDPLAQLRMLSQECCVQECYVQEEPQSTGGSSLLLPVLLIFASSTVLMWFVMH